MTSYVAQYKPEYTDDVCFSIVSQIKFISIHTVGAYCNCPKVERMCTPLRELNDNDVDLDSTSHHSNVWNSL